MTFYRESAPPPDAPPPAVVSSGMNTLAIVAFCLALFFPLGGLVIAHIALRQIKRSGEQGRGLAIIALVLGYSAVATLALVGLLALVAQMTWSA